MTTELCTVTPGVCYEVTASFSGKDDDGLMTATVTVTPRGQPPFATISIRCRASDLDGVLDEVQRWRSTRGESSS